MPLDFVRYTPEVGTIDPDLDRLMEQIVGFWEKKVRESPVVEGGGRAVRGAHAKTFGVVKAEVQILRNVPTAYAQGIYAKPVRHGALIRFSSASNHLGADATLGGVLGCAMKMFDVPGLKLVGRWRSGAPLVLAPDVDNPSLGADPQRNNDFDYHNDLRGRQAPFGCHIRRMNPRDIV